ncbi:hypothetical protein [Pseudonocardia sediminis]|uniref:hypothetical protein n=1 Tax=Pseudonocardia sediminis TaxID=1397368 RepID=UPI0010292D8F|nr:hypothetical protein [Pseudonocardia sediminis]
MQRTDITHLWRGFPGLGRAYLAATALAAALGISLLLGGDARASAASFSTMREVGGIRLWGTLLVLGAVALLVSAAIGRRTVMVALFIGALMHGLVALWFFQSAEANPVASYWGAVVFAGVGFWHISQALEYGSK